jgi:hypothetical protein
VKDQKYSKKRNEIENELKLNSAYHLEKYAGRSPRGYYRASVASGNLAVRQPISIIRSRARIEEDPFLQIIIQTCIVFALRGRYPFATVAWRLRFTNFVSIREKDSLRRYLPSTNVSYSPKASSSWFWHSLSTRHFFYDHKALWSAVNRMLSSKLLFWKIWIALRNSNFQIRVYRYYSSNFLLKWIIYNVNVSLTLHLSLQVRKNSLLSARFDIFLRDRFPRF